MSSLESMLRAEIRRVLEKRRAPRVRNKWETIEKMVDSHLQTIATRLVVDLFKEEGL